MANEVVKIGGRKRWYVQYGRFCREFFGFFEQFFRFAVRRDGCFQYGRIENAESRIRQGFKILRPAVETPDDAD